MQYTLTSPCDACPFLSKFKLWFTIKQLEAHASGEFACHKTCNGNEGTFEPQASSVHCAGALIYLERRDRSHQMMRICKRLGLYDHTKLDMTADVR